MGDEQQIPKAVIYPLGASGGFLVMEDRVSVLNELGRATAFATFHALYYEGHPEFHLSIRPDQVASVIELTPERFEYELETFKRRSEEASAPAQLASVLTAASLSEAE